MAAMDTSFLPAGFEERVAATRARARFMTVNSIDFTDLFTFEVGGYDEDVVITTETAEYLHHQLGMLLGKPCAD